MLFSDGFGDGTGDGYGIGDGNGFGFGDGYGYGSSFGSGYGHGEGNGYGYGKGYACTYAYGDGFGDGYGYGDTDGEGYGTGFGDDDSYGTNAEEGGIEFCFTGLFVNNKYKILLNTEWKMLQIGCQINTFDWFKLHGKALITKHELQVSETDTKMLVQQIDALLEQTKRREG